MDMKRTFDTDAVHAGEPRPKIHGAVVMPIFQSAMFMSRLGEDYHDIQYIRLNNTPNHDAVAAKIAVLEQGEQALVTASGMSAITTGLLTVLKAGDHVLFQNTLYGGTHDFVTRDMPALGIEYDFIDPAAPKTWEDHVRANTKAVYVESISNPMMGVGDLKGVVALARRHGLVTMIDNTFASPLNFRPITIGFDLVFHSCTKYLNGHSDIVAGAIVGGSDWIDRVKRKLDHLGGSLDPHACFLLQRGIKTLGLRVRAQNRSASEIAGYLSQHPQVAKVHYPGLSDNAAYPWASELFDGFGGMLSFELRDGVKAADHLFRKAKIPVIAPSLGGVESLLTRPALTSHAGMEPQARAASGISDALVRMSVGIEDTRDLIADLDQALSV